MHHVIIKSEMAVRMENDRLRAEIERLRADCNRLREIVGEQPLAAPVAALDAQQDTRSFQAGNCKVQIGRLPGAPGAASPSTPMLNPAAAGARGKVAPRSAPKLVPIREETERTQQVTTATAEDETAQRFALLELGEQPE